MPIHMFGKLIALLLLASARPLTTSITTWETTMNMTALLSSFVVAIGLLGTVSPALSQLAPPPSAQTQQIEALVNKAAALVESKGKTAFAEFRMKDSEWWFGDTYLFAYDLKLNVLLVAAFPQNEGRNQTGKTDAKGKLSHNEFAHVAQTKGAGWVNYMFPKPGQTEPSEKWSYVKAVNIDGTPGLIAAGFYPQ